MARKMLVLVEALLLRNGEAPVLPGGKEYDTFSGTGLCDFHARSAGRFMTFIVLLLAYITPCYGLGDYDKTVKVTTFQVDIDSILTDKLERVVIPWLNKNNGNCKNHFIVISMVSDASVTISAVPFDNLTYMTINKSVMGISMFRNYTVILHGKFITRFIKRGKKISRIFRLYKEKNYPYDAQADWGYWIKMEN